MVRVGVIGVGNMGSHHARILSDLAGARLVGVYDRGPERARAVAERYGTKAFADMDALLETVEAVVVAVPPEVHHAVGIRALTAGCHVLMEKPLAHDLPSAQALCDQADEVGRHLVVGYVERFNPAVTRLKEMLARERLLYLNFVRVGPEPPRTGNTGVILDLAIHDMDLLLYLSGDDVVHVTALSGMGGQQDTASLSFLLSGGALAHITANWLTPYKVREVQVATPQRLYRCDLMRQQLTVFSRLAAAQGYAVQEVPIGVQEPLRAQLAAFVGMIESDQPGPVTGREGLRSLALAESCVRAAREAVVSLSGPPC